MDGSGRRHQRPAHGFRSLGFLGVIASVMMMLGALLAPAVAGAQGDPPVVAPEFCAPLLDVLDNASGIPANDEEFEQQTAEGRYFSLRSAMSRPQN